MAISEHLHYADKNSTNDQCLPDSIHDAGMLSRRLVSACESKLTDPLAETATYLSIFKLILNWLLLSNELIVFTALFLPSLSAQIS